MKLAAALIACLALLVAAAPAYAGKDEIVITGDVVVDRGEVLDDVIVVHGSVRVRGRVTGDLIAVSAPVYLNGPVEGDVVALADRTVIGPGGRVGGDLQYGDEKPVITVPGAVDGKTEKVGWGDVSGPVSWFVARLVLWLAVTVSTLLLGLALIWLAPRALEAAREIARTRTGVTIGVGLAVFFGLPAAAVVLFITLVGIPLAIAVLLALLPVYAIGYTTSAWLLGRAIVGPPGRRVAAFLAGWGILRAIALIPFVGGAVWFGAAVFGVGALSIALWRARSAPATAAPAPA